MKIYPSIPRWPTQGGERPLLHTFAKIDGSSLRAEWEARRGWVRFGTRRQPLTSQHPDLGEALALFEANLAEDLARIAYRRFPAMVVFFEFAGEHSFAGQHQMDEPKSLSLFDVAVHRKGILGPVEFLEYFSDLNIAPYLGEQRWDNTFLDQVRRGGLPGASFEGVVGKRGSGHKLEMYKTKNRAWVELVKERYGMERLIELEGEGIRAELGREL